jgi:acetyl-CoA synthetase
MILQASYAMLACARIGAIHSVVFGGFSPEALKDRILDSECKIVITADEGMRGGRSTPLKTNVDIAVAACDCVESVIVVQNTKGDVAWGNKDVWYHNLVEDMSKECPCESFDAETNKSITRTHECANSSWCRIKRINLMFVNHLPKARGIWISGDTFKH